MNPADGLASHRDDEALIRLLDLGHREAWRFDPDGRRLDGAARAGWLYYVAGNSQEQIARTLNVSRQTAQRLVALCVKEGLIKVRLEHRIGRCMELSEGLRRHYDLETVEVVPTAPSSPSAIVGIAQAAACDMEHRLRQTTPIVMAIGTGQTLKAAIEQMTAVDASRHKIVSLAGNIAADGSATCCNVIFKMADRVQARVFPMPSPMIASSALERQQLHAQPMIRDTIQLASTADVTFVGIGDLGPNAPLLRGGFVSAAELKVLQRAGAVGEIVGWAFDDRGTLLSGLTNARVASAPIPRPSRGWSSVIALTGGIAKLPALRAVLRGGLVNGLVTDELTAAALLLGRAESPKRFAGSP